MLTIEIDGFGQPHMGEVELASEGVFVETVPTSFQETRALLRDRGRPLPDSNVRPDLLRWVVRQQQVLASIDCYLLDAW